MTKAKRTYEPWYWANAHTRLYMRRGYLLPGVSVEERVKEIAQRAEALTKVEGFGRKFLNRSLHCACASEKYNQAKQTILHRRG